ncbi:hypothetical protein HDU93_006894, partial [Gonapodya sp. JEL0774]
MSLVRISRALQTDYPIRCGFNFFLNRYKSVLFPEQFPTYDVETEAIHGSLEELRRRCTEVVGFQGWSQEHAYVGRERMFLTETIWRNLEALLDFGAPPEFKRVFLPFTTPASPSGVDALRRAEAAAENRAGMDEGIPGVGAATGSGGLEMDDMAGSQSYGIAASEMGSASNLIDDEKSTAGTEKTGDPEKGQRKKGGKKGGGKKKVKAKPLSRSRK